MKMKFPGRMRPPACGVGSRESDFEVPLARRSLLEQMAGTFFVIYSYSPVSHVLFCSLSAFLSPSFSFLFFFPFHSHAFSLSVVRTLRTRMRDNIEKDFSHVLWNRGVIARISNVKYAFEIKKKRLFEFTFQLMELIRR